MDSIFLVRDALLKSYVSIGCPDALLVGLSGGADSVALLVSLCSIAKERNLRLHAVHVNHNLRDNAGADEAFCRDLCKRLNVPLKVASVHVQETGNIEARAREARYTVFRSAMQEMNCSVLALAHHMDDQAETVLMHLLYGAGTAGLGGMKPFSNGVWRPFLGLKRETLRDYLKADGYSWREDESNSDERFTRNRIRVQMMPVIEACAPEAASAIARTATILQDEDQLLESLAQAWMEKNASKGENCFLRVRELLTEHIALQRRILRKCAAKQGVMLDFEQTERIRHLLQKESGASENLPGGGIAFRGEKNLHVLPQGWNAKRQNNLFPLLIQKSCDACEDGIEQPVPQSQIEGLELRTRRTGDYIQPFGMKGTKPLKEYMIDHGIERPFRAGWPIVCRGSEVLWVVGIGASEKLRVENSQFPEYKLIYAGQLPDQL